MSKAIFVEKQYLGREWIPISIRLVLAVFCFAVYVFTDSHDPNGDVMAVVGFAIIIISIVLGFLLHFSTCVEDGCLIIDGLWTSRRIKIDLSTIVTAEKGIYSRYLFNSPVYNLHKKDTIRFYTAGNEAVHLTDRDGLEYIIGSQRPNELLRAIQEELAKLRK
jgi:heme/copper-type cytochrome/quinol oxidase subunit 4